MLSLFPTLIKSCANAPGLQVLHTSLKQKTDLTYKDLLHHSRKALRVSATYPSPVRKQLKHWVKTLREDLKPKMSSHLYSESNYKLNNIASIPPTYPDEVEKADGRIIIRDNFKALFEKNDKVVLFGEDVGKIGDVNQGAEGLQELFGKLAFSIPGSEKRPL